MLWLYLNAYHDSVSEVSGPILHFAPEPSLTRYFRRNRRGEVCTADLLRSDVDVRTDITHLPFRSGTFALIICNHVLEHVPDDRAAAREIARVLVDSGRAIVTVPIDWTRPTTFEIPTAQDPAERLRLFGQSDHLRAYGRDFVDRLRGAGLNVCTVDFVRTLSADRVDRYGLTKNEPIFVCSPSEVSE